MKNPITQIREEQGLTKKQIAARADISYDTIRFLELGRCPGMRLKTAKEVAKVAGKSVLDIIEQYLEWKQEQLSA